MGCGYPTGSSASEEGLQKAMNSPETHFYYIGVLYGEVTGPAFFIVCTPTTVSYIMIFAEYLFSKVMEQFVQVLFDI